MFIVLAFAFFAIAGIAIDVGLASLTQQQMQVAVDPAAMEGVRLRDYTVYQHISDPQRRPKVSNLVRLIFDDDLHPTGGTLTAGVVTGMPPDDPDRLQLGAGPMLRVDAPGAGPLAPGGVVVAPGTTNAQGATTPGTPTWDDPILQGNQLLPGQQTVGNFEHGDMVSGTYVEGQTHAEDSGYHRPDFVRAVPGSGENWRALGFLVRMRRTTGANPLDDMPGKSSRGPTLPFLWARGSLMMQAPGEDWDPRRDGMSVRATAIAVARPALRASPAPKTGPPGVPPTIPIPSESDDGRAMLGLHPMALSLEYWTELNPGNAWSNATQSFTITPQGAIQGPSPSSTVRGFIVRPSTVSSVGLAVQPAQAADVAGDWQATLKPGYVAIYGDVQGTNRVVGYGFCDAQGNSGSMTFRPGIIAAGGGSTTDVRVWVSADGVSAQIGPDTPALSEAIWDEIFRQNRILAFGGDNNAPGHDVVYDHTRIRPGTLLAPALAR